MCFDVLKVILGLVFQKELDCVVCRQSDVLLKREVKLEHVVRNDVEVCTLASNIKIDAVNR